MFKLKFLWAVLLSVSFSPISFSLTAVANNIDKHSDATLLVAQNTSDYNSLMRKGYAAARRRRYSRARSYFQRALRSRPGDRYARRAIANMDLYLSRRRRIRITYRPRKGKGRRVVGGTRGVCSLGEQTRKSIVPLIPSDADGITTTAQYPSLFLYLPQLSRAQALELVVQNEEIENVQKISLKPNKQSGIVRFDLSSKTGKPLALNQKYTWVFSVICDRKRPDDKLFLEGSIQLTQTSEDVNLDLRTSAPQEQVEIYTKNNLWENALRTVADLRAQKPNDTDAKKYWENLLKSVEFSDKVIQASFLQS